MSYARNGHIYDDASYGYKTPRASLHVASFSPSAPSAPKKPAERPTLDLAAAAGAVRKLDFNNVE
eukprot:jgi/Chlat1/4849/Chrsp31S08939